MSANSMYLLLSSTRYDEALVKFDWNDDLDGPSPLFLLPYHFDRLIEAAEQHNWRKAKESMSYGTLKKLCLEMVKKTVEPGEAFKVRITLAEEGTVEVMVTAVVPFSADPTELVHFNPTCDTHPENGTVVSVGLDSQSTPSSIFTRTKTTQRVHYDEARKRAGVSSSASEVLLFNDDDSMITEATISNVAFYRAGRWLTPSTSTGCLPGVVRRWLLDKKLVDEDDKNELNKDTISGGEWVLLSNGVQGCRLGRITVK